MKPVIMKSIKPKYKYFQSVALGYIYREAKNPHVCQYMNSQTKGWRNSTYNRIIEPNDTKEWKIISSKKAYSIIYKYKNAAINKFL